MSKVNKVFLDGWSVALFSAGSGTRDLVLYNFWNVWKLYTAFWWVHGWVARSANLVKSQVSQSELFLRHFSLIADNASLEPFSWQPEATWLFPEIICNRKSFGSNLRVLLGLVAVHKAHKESHSLFRSSSRTAVWEFVWYGCILRGNAATLLLFYSLCHEASSRRSENLVTSSKLALPIVPEYWPQNVGYSVDVDQVVSLYW